jgi:hypothetical protein
MQGNDATARRNPAARGCFQAQIIEFPLVDRERALRALAETKLADLGKALLDLADLTGSALGISITPHEVEPGVVVVAHLRRWS